MEAATALRYASISLNFTDLNSRSCLIAAHRPNFVLKSSVSNAFLKVCFVELFIRKIDTFLVRFRVCEELLRIDIWFFGCELGLYVDFVLRTEKFHQIAFFLCCKLMGFMRKLRFI